MKCRVLAERRLARSSLELTAISTFVFIAAACGPSGSKPIVVGPFAAYHQNLDLRKLEKAPAVVVSVPQDIERDQEGPIDPAWANAPREPDPVVQRTTRLAKGLTPGVQFDGLGYTGLRPPDPIGDVGPKHYVQMVNRLIAIYSKTGDLLAGPAPINSIFVGMGGSCETSLGVGDPTVVYDEMADRWVVGQIRAGASGICVAVSRTADPVSGGWFGYEFLLSSLPDYYKLGVWHDGYYVGSNSANRAIALDRSAMLYGLPASAIIFRPGAPRPHTMLLPSDHDGIWPPPDGAPNVFYRHVDHVVGGGVDRLELFEFHADFDNPASSTFTGPIEIPVANFASLCNFNFNCVRQPGTTTRLDSITEWPMWRFAYLNFGYYEVLLGNHTVDVGGGQAGIRWFELRKNPGEKAWSLYQQSSYAPDSTSRWMASIAMNGGGTIALGYSLSDASSVYPSLAVTARLIDDPLGEMTYAETTIGNGLFSQLGSNRYGDYSTLTVDPADQCTFWFTGEYFPQAGDWHTRIGSFSVASPGCVPK